MEAARSLFMRFRSTRIAPAWIRGSCHRLRPGTSSFAVLEMLRQDLRGAHGNRANTMLVPGSVVDAQLEKLDIDIHQGTSKTLV